MPYGFNIPDRSIDLDDRIGIVTRHRIPGVIEFCYSEGRDRCYRRIRRLIGSQITQWSCDPACCELLQWLWYVSSGINAVVQEELLDNLPFSTWEWDNANDHSRGRMTLMPHDAASQNSADTAFYVERSRDVFDIRALERGQSFAFSPDRYEGLLAQLAIPTPGEPTHHVVVLLSWDLQSVRTCCPRAHIQTIPMRDFLALSPRIHRLRGTR